MTIHTPYPIANYFNLKEIVVRNANADLYAATDKASGKPLVVWVKRDPFQIDSPEVHDFIERIKKIDEIEPPISEIQFYGVDANGKAFLVFNSLSGNKLEKNVRDPMEAERRFLGCVSVVAKLHAVGLASGDIATESFWIDRNGDVICTGLIGLNRGESLQSFPAEHLGFIAPELRGSTVNIDSLTPASDVFSLGCVACQIFDVEIPVIGNTKISFSNAPKIQPWLKTILERCFSQNPQDRFKDANEILKEITVLKLANKATLPTVRGVKTFENAGKPLVIEEIDPVSWITYLLWGACLLVVSLGIYLVVGQISKKERLADKISTLGNGELADSVNKIESDSATGQQIESEISKLVVSADPLAHQYLVEQALQSESKKIRFLSQHAILDRARKNNLTVSADQVYKYLERTASKPKLDVIELALKILDSSLTQEEQFKYLARIQKIDKDLFRRITIALGIDVDKLDDFAKKLSDEITENKEHGVIAAILSNRELTQIFSDKLDILIEKLSAEDLKWTLAISAERGDATLSKLVKLALKKNLVSGIDTEYYKIIEANLGLPPTVAGKIAKAASQDITADDIKQISKWYESDSEKVLLLLLLDPKQTLKGEIMDNYLGRSPKIEPAAGFATWVNSNLPKERLKFLPLIPLLGLDGLADDKSYELALAKIKDLMSKSNVAEQLVGLKNQKLLALLLKLYPNVLDISDKIELLSNTDKNIRIFAIRSMDTNDMGALKIIGDRFNEETDADVKAEYKKHFWTLANR